MPVTEDQEDQSWWRQFEPFDPSESPDMSDEENKNKIKGVMCRRKQNQQRRVRKEEGSKS